MVVQFLGSTDDECSYLVYCPVQREAVLIHPDPSRIGEYQATGERLGLQLRYVLDTRTIGRRDAGRQVRFEALVNDLGLGQVDLGATPLSCDIPLSLDHIPTIRPVRAWSDGDPTSTCGLGDPSVRVVQVGGGFVEITSPAHPDLPVFTAGDQERQGIALTYGRARVRVGALYIEILPVPDRPDAVAFLVGDRLFTGCPLLAARGATAGEGTPTSLLSLSPDTIVYPSRVVGGMGISTVGLERGCAAVVRPSVVAQVPRQSAPKGHPAMEGYIELEPQEAHEHLASLRVVDVGRPDSMGQIPGAERVDPGDLRSLASSWAREAPVLLVCGTGERSARSAAHLVRMGFRSVYTLAGGFDLWREEGLPVRAFRLPSAADDHAFH